MLNEGTTFGTKLMTEDELAVLKAKQTAAAAAKLMNTNPAEEEPMSPPEGFVDQNIAPLEIPITEKEMNAMINESDNTVDSSPISTIEEEVSPLEVPVENEPVAVSKEEAPQQITPPSDLYEDPATK